MENKFNNLENNIINKGYDIVLNLLGNLDGKLLLSTDIDSFKQLDEINGELLYNEIHNFKPYKNEEDYFIQQEDYHKKFTFKMIGYKIKCIGEKDIFIIKNKIKLFNLVNLKRGKRIIIRDKQNTKQIGKYLYNLHQKNYKPVLYVNCKDNFESTNLNLEKSLKSLYTNETNQRLSLPSSKRYFSKLIIGLLDNNINVILNEFHKLDNIPNMMGYFQQDFDSKGSEQNGTLFVLGSDNKMTNLFSNSRPLYMRYFCDYSSIKEI
ncbi:hypothetical protein ACTFIV_002933 [Dictyostelium citrinum]